MYDTNAFLNTATHGGSVYMHTVRAAYDNIGVPCYLSLDLANGHTRTFRVCLPQPSSQEEAQFIRDYFYARIYNILSILGGVGMRVYPGERAFARELAESLPRVFGIGLAKEARQGYAKCVNVADRMNRALGAPAFSFQISEGEAPDLGPVGDCPPGDIVQDLRTAAGKAMDGLFCGIDIGGTDIKLVGVRNGKIHHIKEYDWNPAGFPTIDPILQTVCLLVGASRALLSMPEHPSEAQRLLAGRILDKGTPIQELGTALAAFEASLGKIAPLQGIGVSFPDVVVRDRIVGGETHKTKGVREHAADYEREFARLTRLDLELGKLCAPEGKVHITNDGHISAYTAAVELAHSPQWEMVRDGIFAHSLGTELGTGWIDASGKVPEFPLEVYNCIIDLGNFPAKALPAQDVRSINNFNTGLSGTLQRYAGQSGAFRLAEAYYRAHAPQAYQRLLELGLLRWETPERLTVAVEPKDMRKAFLEHLMGQAEAGMPQAEEIFRTIGEYLAATWLETETVLAPAAKSRVLFGRFVKRNRCFQLMQEGAKRICPQLQLIAADDELAFTPLMQQLRAHPNYSVAQFGQAVGAVYFAAAML